VTEPRNETVSVLILAHNEAENLAELLPSVREIIESEAFPFEIIVVDGGSDDDTRGVAHERGARVVRQVLPGYANAFREGLAECSGDLVVTLDADLSHRPGFVAQLLAARHDAEIVIASRYVAGGGADMPWTRRALSILLNRTYTLLLGLRLSDVSSGFRLYNRRALAMLTPHGRHFDVLPEIVVLATLAGCRIAEIPFHYHPREAGVSKARVMKFGPSYVQTLVRCMRARWRTAPHRHETSSEIAP